MHVWALGLSCESPAVSGPPRTPHVREERMKTVAGEGKKREILGLPTLQGPTVRGRFFLGLGPPFGPHHDTHSQIQMDLPKMEWPKMDWPKMDWPKLDWPKLVRPKPRWPKMDWPKLVNRMAKTGLAKVVGPFQNLGRFETRKTLKP